MADLRHAGPSLLGNGLWLIAANGMENLGLLVLNFALIRAYGAESHGRFVYYLSAISLIRLVFDLGIGAAMVKRLGERKVDPVRIVIRGLILTAVFNLPFAAAIWLRPGLLPDSGSGGFSLFALWFVVMLIQNMAVSTFNGLRAMRHSFWVSVCYECGKMGSLAYLVLARPDFAHYLRLLNLMLAAAGLAMAALLIAKLRKAGTGAGPDEPVSATLRLALLLWAPTAAIAAFAQCMPIAIKLGLAGRDVSHYNAIVSWSMIASVVLTPAAGAFFVWAAGNVGGGTGPREPGVATVPAEYFRITGAVALGFALVLLLAKDAILRLYGEGFPALGTVFGFFILAQLAEYPRFFTTPFLSGGSHAKAAMLIELGRVALTLAATVAAMATGHSLYAVALSVFSVQAAFGIIRLLHVRGFLAFAPLPGFLRILAAGTAGLAIVSHVPQPGLRTAALIALFLALGGARAADIRRMGRALGWK